LARNKLRITDKCSSCCSKMKKRALQMTIVEVPGMKFVCSVGTSKKLTYFLIRRCAECCEEAKLRAQESKTLSKRTHVTWAQEMVQSVKIKVLSPLFLQMDSKSDYGQNYINIDIRNRLQQYHVSLILSSRYVFRETTLHAIRTISLWRQWRCVPIYQNVHQISKMFCSTCIS
jgi:hypothetical protein